MNPDSAPRQAHYADRTPGVVLVFGTLHWLETRRVAALADHGRSIEEQANELAANTDRLEKQSSSLEERLLTQNEVLASIEDASVADIYRQFAESVHVVEYPGHIATAFAIKEDGTFATNAHVSEPVLKCLKRGEKAWIVSNGGTQRYEVINAVTHSDWRAGQWKTDAGILRARLPSGTQLKVAPLANDNELRSLETGTSLCYVGFPAFVLGDFDSAEKYVPRIYQGHLTRMLTVRDTSGAPEMLQVFEHDMYSWGGASGSPIFGPRGKVVAIHFAGTLVGGSLSRKGQPVGAQKGPAGPKLAVRIDRLRELLNW